MRGKVRDNEKEEREKKMRVENKIKKKEEKWDVEKSQTRNDDVHNNK